MAARCAHRAHVPQSRRQIVQASAQDRTNSAPLIGWYRVCNVSGMLDKSDELRDRVEARKHELLAKYNELKADTRHEAAEARTRLKARLDEVELSPQERLGEGQRRRSHQAQPRGWSATTDRFRSAAHLASHPRQRAALTPALERVPPVASPRLPAVFFGAPADRGDVVGGAASRQERGVGTQVAADQRRSGAAIARARSLCRGASQACRGPRYDDRAAMAADPDRRRLAAQPSVGSEPLPLGDGDRREVGRAARADARVRREPRSDAADDHAARHRARDRPGRPRSQRTVGDPRRREPRRPRARTSRSSSRPRRAGSPARRAIRRGSPTRSRPSIASRPRTGARARRGSCRSAPDPQPPQVEHVAAGRRRADPAGARPRATCRSRRRSTAPAPARRRGRAVEPGAAHDADAAPADATTDTPPARRRAPRSATPRARARSRRWCGSASRRTSRRGSAGWSIGSCRPISTSTPRERRVLNALGEGELTARGDRPDARCRRSGLVHGGADPQARELRPRPGRARRAAGRRADLPPAALSREPGRRGR